jgi:lysozyme
MSWKWCYEDENKNLLTGWNEIDQKWYYFNSNGTMETGWIKHNDNWYYLDPNNGDMKTGWIKDKGLWYYLETDSTSYKGAMICNCSRTIDNKTYSFNASGVMSESILSDKGADFIGSWEGLYLKAYYDPCYGPTVKKYWTIGYGTTYEARPDAFPSGLDSTCTIEQARQWLIEEGQAKAEAIKNDLDSKSVTLQQHELDALISFAYNVGSDAVLKSTLYKYIVSGVRDAATITNEFMKWQYANGVVYAGLTRRRKGEAALFLNSDYTGNN